MPPWLQALKLHWRNNGTKYLGGAQVVVAGIAANAGDFFTKRGLQLILMASGVLTGLRGFINTQNQKGP